MHPQSMKTGEFDSISSQISKWVKDTIHDQNLANQVIKARNSSVGATKDTNYDLREHINATYQQDPQPGGILLAKGNYYVVTAPDIFIGRKTLIARLGLKTSESNLEKLVAKRIEMSACSDYSYEHNGEKFLQSSAVYVPADIMEEAFFKSQKKGASKA